MPSYQKKDLRGSQIGPLSENWSQQSQPACLRVVVFALLTPLQGAIDEPFQIDWLIVNAFLAAVGMREAGDADVAVRTTAAVGDAQRDLRFKCEYEDEGEHYPLDLISTSRCAYGAWYVNTAPEVKRGFHRSNHSYHMNFEEQRTRKEMKKGEFSVQQQGS